MNFRTTVILLILLIGAGTFFIISNSSPEVEEPKAPQADAAGRKLLNVKAADVKKVVVTPGPGATAGQPLELTKIDNQWKITQPINWTADSTESSGLIESIAELRSSATIDVTDQNREGTGLAKPRFTVELTDTTGKTHKLVIGERSELGRLYVQAGGESGTASVVTDNRLNEKLSKGTSALAATLRDKQLVHVSTFDVKQMQIDLGGKKFSLIKEANAWKLTSPQEQAAEMAEVSDILATVTNMRADSFADEASAASRGARFEQPRAIVTISTDAPTSATQPATNPTAMPVASKTVTVVIGQQTDITDNKSWVKVSEPASVAIVNLGGPSLEKIVSASTLSLRDRRVFDVDPEQVSQVAITTETISATQPSQKQSVTLERRKEQLELGPQVPASPGGATTKPTTTPSTKPTDAAKPDDVKSPATKPADKEPSPATKPASTPQAEGTGTNRLLSFIATLTSPTALLQAEGVIPATKPATAAATQPATRPATQPATTPATGPAAAAPAEPAAPPPPPPTNWVIASANGADADDAAVSSVLFDLHPLRATKFLPEMPPATQPAGTQPATQPATTVYVVTIKTIAAGGTAATHELRITDRGGDSKPIGQYKDLVFELERTFLDKLKRDFTPGSAPAVSEPPSVPGGSPFPGGFPPLQ